MKNIIMMAGLVCLVVLKSYAQGGQNAIVGKWMSAEKNLVVEVYKAGDDFKVRIAWFKDERDSTPIDLWKDKKNPDTALRRRNILGMDVLSGLQYNAEDDNWTNGKIYDCSSGKTWEATVWLNDAQTLKVRGYYLFRLLGKTMEFNRMQPFAN